MAFEKEIELPSGATAAYWRAAEIVDCRKDQMFHIRLHGYKSHQHRIDGKPPVVTEDHLFDGDDYPMTELNASSAIVQGYTMVKALPRFEGAVDV